MHNTGLLGAGFQPFACVYCPFPCVVATVRVVSIGIYQTDVFGVQRIVDKYRAFGVAADGVAKSLVETVASALVLPNGVRADFIQYAVHIFPARRFAAGRDWCHRDTWETVGIGRPFLRHPAVAGIRNAVFQAV